MKTFKNLTFSCAGQFHFWISDDDNDENMSDSLKYFVTFYFGPPVPICNRVTVTLPFSHSLGSIQIVNCLGVNNGLLLCVCMAYSTMGS